MLPKTKNKSLEMPAVKPVKVEISTGVSETVRSEILKAFPLIKQNAISDVKNAICGPITEQPAFEKETELFFAGGVIEIPPTAKEKELQQIVFDVKLKYDTLINSLKPLLSHDALVALGEKKKEIFG